MKIKVGQEIDFEIRRGRKGRIQPINMKGKVKIINSDFGGMITVEEASSTKEFIIRLDAIKK